MLRPRVTWLGLIVDLRRCAVLRNALQRTPERRGLSKFWCGDCRLLGRPCNRWVAFSHHLVYLLRISMFVVGGVVVWGIMQVVLFGADQAVVLAWRYPRNHHA